MAAARPDDPSPSATNHRPLRAAVLLAHHADTPPGAAGALASFQCGIIPEDVLVIVLLQDAGSNGSDPQRAMMAWAVDHGQTAGNNGSTAAPTAIQLVYALNATLDPAVTLVLVEPPPALHDHLAAVHACRRVDTHPSAHSANLLTHLTLALSPLDRRALQQLFIDVMPTLDTVSDTKPLMSRHADAQLLATAATDPTTRARLQLLLTHLVRERVLVPYAAACGESPRVHAQHGILYLIDHDRYQAVGQALAHGEILPSLTKPGESILLPFRPIRPHCATCTCPSVPAPSPPTRTTYAQLLYQLVADPDPPPNFECREDPEMGEFTYRVHVRGSVVYGSAHQDRDTARESAARAALAQLSLLETDGGDGLVNGVHVPRPGRADGATCSTDTQLRPPPISTDSSGPVVTYSTGGLGGSCGWSSGGATHAAVPEPSTPIRDARDYPAWDAAKVTSPHPSSPKFARAVTAGWEAANTSTSPTRTTGDNVAVHRTGFATSAAWREPSHSSSSWERAGVAPPPPGPDLAGLSAFSGWRAVVPHPTPPSPPTRLVTSHATGPAALYQAPARTAYPATGPAVFRAPRSVPSHATGPAAFHAAPPPPPPVPTTPAPTTSDPTPSIRPADRTDFSPLIQFHRADIAGGNYISKLVEYLQKAKLPPDTAKYTFSTDGAPAGSAGPVQYGAMLTLFGHRFSVPVQYRRKQDAKNQVARRAMEGLNMVVV
ncbi:hypothetical protein AMAG_01565 [Allomyces macrogynus ATCC 38327]|uniref:Uncharacterized protein n=1 Tax=Allomyces macrogynus (strain ATCC 38327) TaxID=578462 RepID=A0A0L0S024_ALLM3|nr:hypothetical protein AMAG_01565 [Allomyces macrogynus ATCC 38327]|eukprot:KNE55679.1 hypothetical protein AMAG_01565 [Allomyces macrogynus ATCC 38327]